MRRAFPILALFLAGATAPSLLRSLSEGVATTYIYVDGGLPDPGVTPGPAWATKVNNFLLAVDAHDHTSGKGKQVPSAGLNINDDLDFQGHAATNLDHLLLSTSATGVSGLNGVLYLSFGDLWFVDGAGDPPIQLTDADGLHLTGTRGINGQYATDVANPSFLYTTSTKRYTATSDGSTLASLKGSYPVYGVLSPSGTANSYTFTDTDAVGVLLVDTTSNRTITLPVPGSANAGRILTIVDRTGNAATHNVTVQRQTSGLISGFTSQTLSTAYGSMRIVGDGTNWFKL